jgi:O-antigen/teichoic acid export membrane protein
VALESIAGLCLGAQRSLKDHRRVALVQSGWAAAVLAMALVLPLAPGQVARFTGARAALAGIVALGLIAALAQRGAVISPGMGPRTLVRAARPFLFSEVAALVYMKADLVLVGLILGAAGASLYGPAINLLNVALIVPTALFYAMVPILSHAFVHDGPGFAAQARRQTMLHVGAGLLLSLALWLAAPAVIWIYGPAYAGAVGVLRLLCPLPLLRASNFALAAVLIGGDCQQARTWVQWAAAAFNVGANLLVIHWLGVAGVAGVFVLTELLLTAGYGLVVYRRLGRQLALSAVP